MRISPRTYSPLSLAPLLLLVLLGSGGCVAAGLAAVGPMLGSIAALGDRTVERTIPADVSTTWGATVDALARMGVRVEQTEKAEKAGNRWQLTGIADDVTVYGTLERVTSSMTKVSIRVEAGSIYADKRTAEELINQVGASLASLTRPGSLEARTYEPARRLEALQQAIERLGAKVDNSHDGQERPQPGPREDRPASQSTIMASPIITVPVSAGVATVPGPLPVLMQAPALRRDKQGVSVQEESQDATRDIMANPLRSVDVLRPVEGLTIRPASQ